MDRRLGALTFDIENDCGLSSFKGIEIGLPKILEILRANKIRATFFVTGEVAERNPKLVKRLYRHHEVACHGYHHESFDQMDAEKERIIKMAKERIEEVVGGEIFGFRAPYLRTCPELFQAIKKLGFEYDSSLAWFKISHWKIVPPITEYRVTIPNVLFRFPVLEHLFKLNGLLSKVNVLYFHPWEAIDVRNLFISRPHYFWNLITRPDRWLNSGRPFLKRLVAFIHFQQQYGVKFVTLHRLGSLI